MAPSRVKLKVMKQNDLDQPATKRDVEDIINRLVPKIVGDIVGTIVGDALQLIAGRFDEQEKATKADTSRTESKLDATIDAVDELKERWRKLEYRLARATKSQAT
jgi:hypothetical protein